MEWMHTIDWGDAPTWGTFLVALVAATVAWFQYKKQNEAHEAERERERKEFASQFAAWMAREVRSGRPSAPVRGKDRPPMAVGVVMLNSSTVAFHDVKVCVELENPKVNRTRYSDQFTEAIVPPGRYFRAKSWTRLYMQAVDVRRTYYTAGHLTQRLSEARSLPDPLYTWSNPDRGKFRWKLGKLVPEDQIHRFEALTGTQRYTVTQVTFLDSLGQRWKSDRQGRLTLLPEGASLDCPVCVDALPSHRPYGHPPVVPNSSSGAQSS